MFFLPKFRFLTKNHNLVMEFCKNPMKYMHFQKICWYLYLYLYVYNTEKEKGLGRTPPSPPLFPCGPSLYFELVSFLYIKSYFYHNSTPCWRNRLRVCMPVDTYHSSVLTKYGPKSTINIRVMLILNLIKIDWLINNN